MEPKRPLSVALVLALSLPLAAAQTDGAAPQLLGFTAARAARQLVVEERFKAIPTPESARTFHRYFTAEPHPAGSPRNNEIAEYIAAQWKAQGLEDVVIRRYDVLSSNPREVEVEMVAPVRYVPSLREDAYPTRPRLVAPEASAAPGSRSRRRATSRPRRLRQQRQPRRLRRAARERHRLRGARSSSSATRTRTAIAGSRPSPPSARGRRR